jgi:glycogen synthase
MTRKSKKRPLRLTYLAGPGDVIGTFRAWRRGEDDSSQVAVTYSAQFYDLCQQLGAEATVIAYPQEDIRLVDGKFDVRHRRVRLQNMRGPFFHLGWYLFSARVALTAILARSDVAILMTGTHLIPYWSLRAFGIKVVLTQHCVIWPKVLKRSFLWRVVHALDRGFFRRGNQAIMSMSNDISQQIEKLTDGSHPKISYFLPHYREQAFSDIRATEHSNSPFTVLFAGRIEENKGVFDILEIAKLLRKSGSKPVLFNLAGDGSAMAELRRRVDSDGLTDAVILHGYCNKVRMRELLSNCHVVLVPTKAEMIEGFNKVVAEAVLAHRPFITSHLCPAIEYVRNGGIEVPSDDVRAYAEAILTLAESAVHYENCVAASYDLSKQFLDPSRSWKSVLEKVLGEIGVT